MLKERIEELQAELGLSKPDPSKLGLISKVGISKQISEEVLSSNPTSAEELEDSNESNPSVPNSGGSEREMALSVIHLAASFSPDSNVENEM